MKRTILFALLFLLIGLFINAKLMTEQQSNYKETTLGAGCFWCVEAVFEQLKGVQSVEAGYSGGQSINPTYKEVCSGTSGYVEVARIVYDPSVISFSDILYVFWRTHDPTSLNRQGNDVGSQYRSVVFYHNDEQKTVAEKVFSETKASGEYDKPIVTAIEPLENYYPAEDYHQNYFENNPNQPYCSAVIRPKVEKFKKLFKEQLK